MKIVLDKNKIINTKYKEIIFSGKTYYTDGIVIESNDKTVIFDGFMFGIKNTNTYIENILAVSENSDDFFNRICINGEYAIVVFDYVNEIIMAKTDPLGTLPLYYNTKSEYSTQIIDISNLEEFDLIYRSKVLKWGYNTDNRTPWKDVKRIMPMQLHIDAIDGRAFEQYIDDVIFDIFYEKNINKYKNKCASDAVQEILHNTIIEQLKTIDTKDEIAVLLSGGLDSSIITYELLNINKNIFNNKYKFVFYTLDEDQKDVECTKELCKQYGIKTNFLTYDKENIDYEAALKINQTPIDLGSMVSNQKIFSQIPQKVYFTGDGADCLLGGFRRIDEYDSQLSDMFEEHPFYYSPKGSNAVQHFGIKLNCPFNNLELITYAFNLPLEERTHKKCLKEAYKDVLPDCIINRQKLPLKNKKIVEDKNKYRYNLAKIFYNMNWKDIKDKG